MMDILIASGALVITALVTAFAFVEYAKVKYGSTQEIAKIRESLDKLDKTVVQYKKDDIHRRVSAVEAKVGTGYSL